MIVGGKLDGWQCSRRVDGRRTSLPQPLGADGTRVASQGAYFAGVKIAGRRGLCLTDRSFPAFARPGRDRFGYGRISLGIIGRHRAAIARDSRSGDVNAVGRDGQLQQRAGRLSVIAAGRVPRAGLRVPGLVTSRQWAGGWTRKLDRVRQRTYGTLRPEIRPLNDLTDHGRRLGRWGLQRGVSTGCGILGNHWRRRGRLSGCPGWGKR